MTVHLEKGEVVSAFADLIESSNRREVEDILDCDAGFVRVVGNKIFTVVATHLADLSPSEYAQFLTEHEGDLRPSVYPKRHWSVGGDGDPVVRAAWIVNLAGAIMTGHAADVWKNPYHLILKEEGPHWPDVLIGGETIEDLMIDMYVDGTNEALKKLKLPDDGDVTAYRALTLNFDELPDLSTMTQDEFVSFMLKYIRMEGAGVSWSRKPTTEPIFHEKGSGESTQKLTVLLAAEVPLDSINFAATGVLNVVFPSEMEIRLWPQNEATLVSISYEGTSYPLKRPRRITA